MFTHLSLVPLCLIFAAGAGAVWWAGVELSDTTDVLSERLGLGQALGGTVLLAIATNLPEIAITASAAWAGDLSVAVGNILGGIAHTNDGAGGPRRRRHARRAAADLPRRQPVAGAGGRDRDRRAGRHGDGHAAAGRADRGDAAAGQVGLSGVLFGATVLAAATSLPELSTGLTSVRLGDYQLAISDIFGGNAFLPVLFLLATLLSGEAVLPSAHKSDIYLAALGVLLTAVYIVGLIFRPRRRVIGMGVDSAAALTLYVVGTVGLFAIEA